MTLINTTDELKNYVESNNALEITTIMPSLKTAESRFVAPLLGKLQYAALISAYETANQDISQIDDEPLKLLAEIAQKAVSNLGMMLVTDRIAITISESGMRRNETGDSKSAYQYQEINLKESYANAGFDALEDMLILMDEDTEHYADWRASDAFTEQKRYILSSGTIFSKYYEIYRSRITYMAIRSIMHRVENFTIRDIIGLQLLTAIRAGLRSENLIEAYQALIDDYIGPAIAMLTVAKGLVERAVEVNDKGVTVVVTAPDKNRPSREPAPSDKVKLMIDQLNQDAIAYLNALSVQLEANPDLYPDYQSPVADRGNLAIDNNIAKSIFGMP